MQQTALAFSALEQERLTQVKSREELWALG